MDNKGDQLSQVVKKGWDQIKEMLSSPQDIVSVIKEDHKPLKELIKIMKDGERSLKERTQAFQEFAPLLLTHAKAEEQSLYELMKTKEDFKEDAFEGDTEHEIADQLMEEVKRATDENQLGAKIKVLAELVEHHIEEEENDMLPEVKRAFDEKRLIKATEKYIAVQAKIISEGQDDSPHEKDLPELAH